MADTIRWGILGTGHIAAKFALGLRAVPGAALTAVGSRTQEAADRFAAHHGIPRRHASYAALAADPQVDAIYVSTPHNLHRENTVLAAEAGKAVLCEKPFAINARQAEEMISAARKKGVFLMEAMWTRFLPAARELRRLTSAGEIGEIQMIEGNFGFPAAFNPKSRLFDPELGGGALLDLGIYPLSLAYYLLGPPARIEALASLGRTGVDERGAVLLGYPAGPLAVLHFSVTADMPNEFLVMGTRGRIRAHAPIAKPERLTIVRREAGRPATPARPLLLRKLEGLSSLTPLRNFLYGRRERTLSFPLRGNGYNYEAAEVGRCLREGRRESAVMPLDETLDIMRTMDRIRAGWGLRYPGE